MKLLCRNLKRLSNNTNSSFSDSFSGNFKAKLVELEPPTKHSRIRSKNYSVKKIALVLFVTLCSFALIIFIIFYGLGMYLSNENNQNGGNEDENSQTHPQIPGSRHKLIYRERWGGRTPLYKRDQKLPVKYVIISHTVGQFCDTITACSNQMVAMQSLHVSSGSPDIGYNFVIGGDENIYVGRDWENHNFHMNLDTIGISFIGNYIYDNLTPGMIEATQDLLTIGVKENKLEKDFIIVAHNQTWNTQSPGPNIYKQIKFWPHFSPEILPDIDK